MQFLAPGFLWLLLGVPLLWFLPRPAKDVAHAALRTVLFAGLVLALARPVSLVESTSEHHVLVIDTSESVLTDAAGVEAAWRASLDDGAIASVVAADRSDLGAGLARAASHVPTDGRGAVTLATDGLATAPDWAPALTALAERGIPLHVLPLATSTDDVRPVRLAPLGPVRVGQTARIAVELAGPAATCDLTLHGPDGPLTTVEALDVDGATGRAGAVLEIEPADPGFLPVTLEVSVRAGPNARTDNDTLTTTLAVQDPLRVLYVGERVQAGADRLGDLLGGGFDIDEARPGDGGGVELDGYDLAVFDDAPAKSVPEPFQRDVVEAVVDRGLGLFVTGGNGSFGPGGWTDTPVAGVLPVELVQKEEKRDPSTTLVVIIDTSGSMGGNRVQLAKEVARLSMRRLLPHDKVGIVEFYGAKRWAAPIQPASNSIEIERALNRLDAGGGTVILPAIEEAYYGLKNVRTRYKHVLILTDGGVETGAFEPLLRRMADEGMNVSTVLIGPDAHSEFLVNLANWGKGRFYSVPNRFNLPEILLKQPASAKLPGYRPGTHVVRARGGAGWWGDVDRGAVPELAGYVETKGRPGAETLLETLEGNHPVLASWRFGLGRVTAFPTEPTGPGTQPWRGWEGYGPLLARVLTKTANDAANPFVFSIARDRHELTVTAERRIPGAGVPRAVTMDTDERELVFRERADGTYTATLAFDAAVEARIGAGPAASAGGHGWVRLVSPAHADRAPEHNVDPARALDLAAAARLTGGEVVSGALEGFTPTAGGGDAPVAVRDLRPLLLALALIAYLADVAWRRRPGMQMELS